jgi:hypothetical protein
MSNRVLDGPVSCSATTSAAAAHCGGETAVGGSLGR